MYNIPSIYITSNTFLEALNQFVHSLWLWVLIAVISVDIVTGTCKSIKYKNWDSSISKDGLLKHFGILIIVTLIAILTRMSALEPAIAFSIMIKISFILTYVGSIMENFDALGWPVPDFARAYFNRVRSEYDKKITDKYVEQEIETTEPNTKKVVTVQKTQIEKEGK